MKRVNINNKRYLIETYGQRGRSSPVAVTVRRGPGSRGGLQKIPAEEGLLHVGWEGLHEAGARLSPGLLPHEVRAL